MYKTSIILSMCLINFLCLSQSKKKQIIELKRVIDSLKTAQNEEKFNYENKITSLHSTLKEKEFFITNYKDSLEIQKMNLQSVLKKLESKKNESKKLKVSIDSLLNEVSKTMDDRKIITNDNLIDFLNHLTNGIGINIPFTKKFTERKGENGGSIYEIDFSMLSPKEVSENYNLPDYNGLSTIIYTDSKKHIKYIKYERTCCPGDNEEEIILPYGNDFVTINHYYGQYGGSVKFNVNSNEIWNMSYESEDSSFFLDLK